MPHALDLNYYPVINYALDLLYCHTQIETAEPNLKNNTDLIYKHMTALNKINQMQGDFKQNHNNYNHIKNGNLNFFLVVYNIFHNMPRPG